MGKIKLGVNIDHVATVRQARMGFNPKPFEAALVCEKAGADGITAHLREDRRHIQDADMFALASAVKSLNMEMALTEEMIDIATMLVKPENCCLVPEKREELTTEGGLDAVDAILTLKDAVPRLKDAGIKVSLFVDPDFPQIHAALECGAEYIELHTGAFANASGKEQLTELKRLIEGAQYAHSIGLIVNAGHGIDYENIKLMKEVPYLHELNIGHSIVSRAVFTGLENAVREMIGLMADYDKN